LLSNLKGIDKAIAITTQYDVEAKKKMVKKLAGIQDHKPEPTKSK
jgi:hypothetical protein